jgi:hypothetical protein
MVTLAIVAVGVALFLWLRRSRRAFALEVRDGIVVHVAGWLPGAMLADYRSALRAVTRGTVEGHLEEGGLRVTGSGDVDEFTLQRLRNIARLYPLAGLRASRAPEHQVAKAAATAAVVSTLTERRD